MSSCVDLGARRGWAAACAGVSVPVTVGCATKNDNARKRVPGVACACQSVDLGRTSPCEYPRERTRVC